MNSPSNPPALSQSALSMAPASQVRRACVPSPFNTVNWKFGSLVNPVRSETIHVHAPELGACDSLTTGPLACSLT